MNPSHPVFDSLESRRLLSAGELDSAFGSAGLALVKPPGVEFVAVQDLVTLADGRLLVAATVRHVVPEAPWQYTTSLGLVRLTATGAADTAFGGGDGFLDTGLSTNPTADLMLDATGKVLWTDARILVRFNPDGSFDTAFGPNGTGQITMGASSAGLALQADGKILVGGSRSGTLYAQRFLSDGSPDNSFSYDSVATVRGPIARGPAFSGIAAMPNGTIYLGCTWAVRPMGENTEDAVYEFDIVHLRANGTIDTAYGTDGFVRKVKGVYIGMSGALAVDSQERATFVAFSDTMHWIWRYDRTGKPDPTFGTNGQHDPSVSIDAQRLFLQCDGSAIVGGSVYEGTAPGGPGPDQIVANPAILRTTPNGQIDTSFGTNGKVVIQTAGAIPESNERSASTQALTVARDGSILIATRDRDSSIVVARLWRDDSPIAAQFSASPIAAGTSRSMVFTVTYRDGDDAIDLDTLDGRDLYVTGPDGYSAYAKFDRVSRTSDAGKTVTVRYKLAARGGSWGAEDNGRYSVRLRAGQVADRAGTFATSRTIGSVDVNLPV
jgi:uncharacterized delta-60 repeat protein